MNPLIIAIVGSVIVTGAICLSVALFWACLFCFCTYRKVYSGVHPNKEGRYIHRQVDHAIIYKPGEI